MDKTQITYMTLSDLTRKVREVVYQAFGEQNYWIVAEVSGHKFYPDRDRHYFDLVEKIDHASTETAKVKANAWELGSERIELFERVTGQRFGDGLQVLICVRINFHIVHGFSLTLIDIDPNFTLGNLERFRRETLQRLVAENADTIQLSNGVYTTRNKQQKVGSVIQNIALIGSPRSEGYTDFVHTMTHNQYGYKFKLDFFYSSVQGVGAEQELVKTLIQIYEASKSRPYDCVVITRGGGARTDFLVFDTYALSRAVARFPIPIITGIGHHKDVSIVDMMAHTQTKTPTKAAEFILAHNKSFEENVISAQQRIIIKTQQLLSDRVGRINRVTSLITRKTPALLGDRRESINNQRQRIGHLSLAFLSEKKQELRKGQHAIIDFSFDSIYHHDRKLDSIFYKIINIPMQSVSRRRDQIDNMLDRIRMSTEKFFTTQNRFLLHQRSLFRMISPANILKKGFAIVKHNGRIVVDPQNIEQGDDLTVTLQNTDIETTVKRKLQGDGKFDI